MTQEITGVSRFRFHILVIMLGAFAAAALVHIAAVFGEGYPDWMLHAAMWGLLGTYGFLALSRIWEGKPLRAWLYTLTYFALGCFWISLMVRLVPETEIFRGSSPMTRSALPVLWVSIVLLGFTCVGMLVLAVIVPRARRQAARAQDPRAEE